MHLRSLPVLDDDDEPLVDAFAAGLNRGAAQVLAYLVAREGTEGVEDAASRLEIRMGTGLGREAVSGALEKLERADLATATDATGNRAPQGRPPGRWLAVTDRDTATARIGERHADALLTQARTVAAALDGDGDPTACGDALTVALNWTPNGLHAPLLVAADRELWDGVDVTLEGNPGSRAALDALCSGTADIAVAGAATVLRGIERGRGVTPLALLHQRTTTVLYTTREAFGEPFTTVEQLRGRRIATPAGSETAMLVRLFLSQANVLEDVEFVDSPGEEREALRSGEADAATGVFADPARLADCDRTVDSLLVADHFPAPGQALVVPGGALDGRAATLRRFLAGTVAGWAAARRESAATGELVAARTDRSAAVERRRFERAVEQFVDGETVRQHGWGWQSVEAWSRLRTAMELTGMLDP